MPSSTSSSDAAVATSLKPILIVLAICVFVYLAFEGFARVGVHRLSSYVGRNRREQLEALSLRHGADRPTVLVAGTSLLLEGVDFPRFAQMLGDKWDVHRWVMEQTSYLDWYYGLRRMYANGSRPDAVVLMMGPLNFARTSFRGEYSARKMLLTKDVWEASRALQLHPTEATNLLAANLSEFYGLKTELRKVLLIRMIPNLPKLTGMIIRHDNRQLPDDRLRTVGLERFAALRSMAEANGGQVMLAIPPRPSKGTASDVLKEAGREEGVPVLVSVPQGEMGYSYYRDGNHLKPHGAAIYTDRLEPDLRRALEEAGIVRAGSVDSTVP